MIRPLRITMLAAQHHPFDNRVFHHQAAALRDAGHSVTVVTPNPGGMDPAGERDGIAYRLYDKAHSGVRRKVHTLRSLIRLALAIPTDVYHVHEGDAALMAGAYAKRKLAGRGTHAKLVYDVHEIWPWFYAASTSRRWLRPLLVQGFMAYERYLLTHDVDAVITAHELELQVYRWQNPMIASRWVQTAPSFGDPPPDRSGPVRVIGHEGFFTLNRGMDQILEAFEQLAPDYPDLTLRTVGDFQTDRDREWYDHWANRTGLGARVHLSGWVDAPDAPVALDQVDVGVVALREDEHSMRVWPANKLMNYASRALPSVVCTRAPYARQEIEGRGHGIVCDHTPDGLARAVRALLDDPGEARAAGQRAYQFAREHWDWERHRAELLHLYDDLSRPTVRLRRPVKLQG